VRKKLDLRAVVAVCWKGDHRRSARGKRVTRIVHAVEGFGGTVKDLAGDGVLALFAAPATHEDDPERELSAAMQIADEVESYARDVAESQQARLGGVGFACRRRAEKRQAAVEGAHCEGKQACLDKSEVRQQNRSGVGANVDVWRGNRPGRVPAACGRRAKKPARKAVARPQGSSGHPAHR
jgi:hypothetical protein